MKRMRRAKSPERSSDRRAAVLTFLKKKVWPRLPKNQIGRTLTRAEEDAILGYGPEGA